MAFLHAPLRPELQVPLPEKYALGKRFHLSPGGILMPSVTSVLSLRDKPAIDAWRARVGEEYANKVCRYARKRGDLLHTACERYLKNEMPLGEDASSTPGTIKDMFASIKPHLDQHVTLIHAQETPLYSTRLGCAGRADAVVDWDGIISILDFKSSTEEKKVEWVEKYFIQTFAYACMWQEMTGQPINQVVVIIACDDGSCQVYIRNKVEQKREYVKELIAAIKAFNDETKRIEVRMREVEEA